MNITKLPSGSYRIRQNYNNKTYSITVDHKPSQKEATILMAELLQDVKKENGTFKKYADEYIENRRNVLSPSSVRTYKRLITLLSEDFLKLNIYNITQEDVQREINDYASTHSPKSTRSMHGFIASVLKAIRPSFKLNTKLPQKEAKKNYLPTNEEVKAILAAAKGTEDSIGFQLGVLGMRRGEICALEMDDLNGNELTISKTLVYGENAYEVKHTPKTDESFRTIILPDHLVEEIRAQGSFFDLSPQKLNSHLHEYQKKLGIPQFRFHDLRHYFASYCHANGICDADIMAMGGWKSDHVMKAIYRDAMEESKKKAATKIANAILA